jgi:hypothetical protein
MVGPGGLAEVEVRREARKESTDLPTSVLAHDHRRGGGLGLG